VLLVVVVMDTRLVATATRRSRDTLPSKDTHLKDTLRSSTVTLRSSMVTLSKVATPLLVTLAHPRVMVVAWVACSLEAQQLRLWLMEHTRFLVVVTVGTWEVDTWEEA
jgi:hypothetical protein